MKRTLISMVTAAFLLCGMLAVKLQAATHTVEVGDFFFRPSTVSINVGDTVNWSVIEGFHDTTSGNPPTGATWESDLLLAGESFQFTFDTAGSYPYVCAFHFGIVLMPGLVSVASGPVLTPPTVAITSPANNSMLDAPATISIAADAADSNGSVVSVQFFVGANLLAIDTTAPYTTSCSGLPGGNYVLTAVATDNDGLSSTSAPVNVTVRHIVEYRFSSFSPNALTIRTGESILFTNRDGGTTSSHTVTGTGGETFCGNSFVMFCNRTFNTAGNFPYRCLPHSFQSGGGFSGMTGSITVANNVVRPPIVVLTQPANQQSFTAPAAFVIEAGCAIDPDGTVTQVQFFQASGGGAPSLIGTDTSSPFNAPAVILTPGTYTLTARATDNAGLISTSAPVVVTVQAPPDIRLAAPSFTDAGLFRFNFNSISGITYRIDGSANMDSVVPMTEIGSLTATGAVSTFVDPDQRSYRMYRVRLEP